MRTDILLDQATGDLLMINGRIQRGESSEQHQNLLLITEAGAWKENPLTGVAAFKYLENENPAELYRAIRQQFARDGMTVLGLVIGGSLINVNATYE